MHAASIACDILFYMSLFSFFEKPKRSIAFSLDNGNIRWVSVMREKNTIQVIDYGSYQMGPDIIDARDAVLNDALFVSKLRTVVSKINFDSKIFEANIVIPDHQAVMFHTHVTKEVSGEMEMIIIDHIKTYCKSHDLLVFSDYVCEYDIIHETPSGYDVHVTLVPRLYTAHLARLFKQAGVIIKHIETAHHAVAKSCLDTPLGKGVVLVSFGLRQTTVALVHANHSVSQEIIPIGVENLYRSVQRFLTVDLEYAKKIIERHGILQTHPDNGLLGELYLEVSPIYRSIDQQLISLGRMPYKNYGQRFSADTLVVYGEGLHVKGLAHLLGEKTQLQVYDLDVWAGHGHDRARIMNLPAAETLTYAEPLSLALLYLE